MALLDRARLLFTSPRGMRLRLLIVAGISRRRRTKHEKQTQPLQETVTRIVELGRAYHASALIRFLDEVDAEGYVVSTEHVPGIFES